MPTLVYVKELAKVIMEALTIRPHRTERTNKFFF